MILEGVESSRENLSSIFLPDRVYVAAGNGLARTSRIGTLRSPLSTRQG